MPQLLGLWTKIKEPLRQVIANPLRMIDYIKFILSRKKYFGNQEFYNNKILRHSYKDFAQGLPVFFVENINSKTTAEYLLSFNPKLVFIFGTSLIRTELLSIRNVIFVNMHWGWSPDYRAEGIVSALALEGPSALGVTVHLISEIVDGGDILYQGRPRVDETDNFYSVGLKLTVLGIDLFRRVSEDLSAAGSLIGQPQDLSKGGTFSSRYMRKHPQIYQIAWTRLQNR